MPPAIGVPQRPDKTGKGAARQGVDPPFVRRNDGPAQSDSQGQIQVVINRTPGRQGNLQRGCKEERAIVDLQRHGQETLDRLKSRVGIKHTTALQLPDNVADFRADQIRSGQAIAIVKSF